MTFCVMGLVFKHLYSFEDLLDNLQDARLLPCLRTYLGAIVLP